MRANEYLEAACAFTLCLSSLISSACLHVRQDVQAFSYAPTQTQEECILGKTEHGGAEYLKDIIFLGDSRTYGLKAFSMLDGGTGTHQVWTPRNGTMSIWDMHLHRIVFPQNNCEITVAEAVALSKPKILIISLGFNGFDIVKKDYFVGEYLKLIEDVQSANPSTAIVLQSMFPVCSSYKAASNAKIQEGNQWILEIAELTNVFYLNTQEVLTDENGYLKKEYSTDGCHLTPLGLDVELEYICTHMIRGD